MNSRSTRGYHSPVRKERAAATRARLLDAALRVLGRDPERGSIADVAAEAGVAVPTVYRHFGSREALATAVEEHVAARLGEGLPADPAEVGELLDALPQFFANYAAVAADAGPLVEGPLARDSRRSRREARLAWIEQAFASTLRGLPEPDRTYLRDVLAVQLSTAPVREFEEYLGLTGDEAADRVAWLVRTLTSHARKDGA